MKRTVAREGYLEFFFKGYLARLIIMAPLLDSFDFGYEKLWERMSKSCQKCEDDSEGKFL